VIFKVLVVSFGFLGLSDTAMSVADTDTQSYETTSLLSMASK